MKKSEQVTTFSEKKFLTTLKSVVQESLSLSELLCFYYTTGPRAREILRAGLPASAAERGVVFSLHAYHDLTAEDRAQFLEEKLEVMLVVALPRRLLEPLRDGSGSENDSGERPGDRKSSPSGHVRTAKREKRARSSSIFFLAGSNEPVGAKKYARESRRTPKCPKHPDPGT